MSKTNKSSSTTSSLSLNGTPKVTTTMYQDGTSTSNYQMSPWEKLAYEYAQEEFAKNLGNMNVFSEDTLKSLSNQIDAYTKSGIKKIDEIYSPMLKNLQNDIASRFGNLDNSIFLDKLSGIEDKRADSVATLSENIVAKESSLKTNELLQRYNYLTFLNNYQNQILQNALGTTSNNSGLLNSIVSSTNTDSDTLTDQLNGVLLQSIVGLFGK